MSWARGLCVVFALALLAPGVPAQVAGTGRDAGSEPGGAAGARAGAQGTRYEITEITYTIEGRTREFALRKALDLKPGLRFATLSELVEFLDDQRQLLRNERPIAESRIAYSVVGTVTGGSAADGAAGDPTAGEDVLAVRVDVFTVDSWNIIAVPFLRYTSDDGLSLSIRARDYNFLGTLERVAGDVDWEAEWPDGGLFDADRVDFSLRGAVPFEWQGYDWRWDTSLSAAFIDGASNRYAWRNRFGITFPWLFGLDWSSSILQDLEVRDVEDPDPVWFSTGVRLTVDVPTPWWVPGLGAVRYVPAAEVRQPYSPDRLSDGRRGATATFDQRLSAGRINWTDNFRFGTRAELINTNAVNLYRAFIDDFNLPTGQSVIEGQVLSFGAFLQDGPVPMGVSARAGTFVQLSSFSGGPADISSRIRGIRRTGDELQGEFGGYANVDFYGRAFRWERYVEGHVGLFLDIGAANTFEEGMTPDDFVFGSGVEVILFPLFSRAAYLRASLGFDLRAAIEDREGGSRRREIFIGIDHHY